MGAAVTSSSSRRIAAKVVAIAAGGFGLNPALSSCAGGPPGAGADAIPREFLRRLASSFDRRGMSVLPTARRGAVAVPGIIEPLSAREREVLALPATGHPNRSIADELVITVDTVKRHVSHVFEKLGVENRTQAVARARQLGLLP